MDQTAFDGKAGGAGHVEQWFELGDLVAGHQVGINPIAAHGIAAFGQLHHIGIAMAQKHCAARAEHDVVIEVVAEIMPELQAEFE